MRLEVFLPCSIWSAEESAAIDGDGVVSRSFPAAQFLLLGGITVADGAAVPAS